jgi:hypothetical protein
MSAVICLTAYQDTADLNKLRMLFYTFCYFVAVWDIHNLVPRALSKTVFEGPGNEVGTSILIAQLIACNIACNVCLNLNSNPWCCLFRRKLPLTPEKFQGGYAQIFAKNRGKKSKDKQSASAEIQSSSKPVKAFTTHAQTNETPPSGSYSQNYYNQTNPASFHPYNTSTYTRQVSGYTGQVTQTNVPEPSNQPQGECMANNIYEI